MTTRNLNFWNINNISTNQPLLASLQESVGGHPIVAQLLIQRGVTTVSETKAFLDSAQYPPAPPADLPDLIVAVETLLKAIENQQKILIWGDFDVDGQTATALLLDALRQVDALVSFYIPHRIRESHGIQPDRLLEVIQEHQPEILLTCDTGITEHKAIEQAVQQGITVLVTDHHDLPPGALPPAQANVNPKRLPEEHPLRTLPGVGVAYKLIEELYTRLDKTEELATFLDLVALGIVADVAEQRDDTRYLLQRGLIQLQQTRRIGLQALFAVINLNPEHITTEDIGFQIAPRLNAAGRLDDATPVVDLLTTTDQTKARTIAANLDGLNKKRRLLQRQMMAGAQGVIAEQPDLLDHTALVIAHSDWHPGLLGIVAGQLAERYNRPCILLTLDGPEARGSARSRPGYHIGTAITAQADLLTNYGGHAGAAGLSLPIENIDRFRRKVSQTLQDNFDSEAANSALQIDAAITLDEITPGFVEELFRLAPFGEGNPAPLLMATNLTLAKQTTLGRERLHRKLTVQASHSEVTQQVLWWNGSEHKLPDGSFDLAFTLGWNTYKGNREVAITLQAIREQPTDTAVATPPAPQQVLVDWRDKTLDHAVNQFRTEEVEGIIWAEGSHWDANKDEEVVRRHDLVNAPALLILTAPPSAVVLHEILEQVQVERVYIAAIPPQGQQFKPFLNRLLQLCKATITAKEGHGDLEQLAGTTAQTIATVSSGLRYLAARNAISLEEHSSFAIIASGQKDALPLYDVADTEAELRYNLAESAAYRSFFAKAKTLAALVN